MDIVRFFKHAIQQNKLSHLYMIVGPKGGSRNDLIIEVINLFLLKKIKNKESLSETNQVQWIEPEGVMIKKQQIVDLQQEFSKTSLSDGKRVYVIDQIENMNVQSSNALLKFLEEPLSAHTIGFLLTDQPQSIIDTITSRAQVLTMTHVEKEAIENMLIKANVNETFRALIPELTQDIQEAKALIEYPETKQIVHILESMSKHTSSQEDFEAWLLEKTTFIEESKQWFAFFMQALYRYLLDLKYPQALMRFHFLKHEKQHLLEVYEVEYIDELLEGIQQMTYEQRYFINLGFSRRKLIHMLKGLLNR